MATWEEVEQAGEEMLRSLRKLRDALDSFDVDAELSRREATREAELSDDEVDAELDRLAHD